MTTPPAAPWHTASFDRCLLERLPALLAQRIPLGEYRVEADGEAAYTITLSVESGSSRVPTTFERVPRPDAQGIFTADGRALVVVPTADTDALDGAEIRCVGQQLLAIADASVGEAPREIAWDEALLRAWVPIDQWIRTLLERSGQQLDETNWLSRATHLRRILLPERPRVFAPAHYGRTCPIETPEGPNIAKVLVVSWGAEIAEGKLVIRDPDPRAGFGLAAHMAPLLEHDEPARLLMGVNMMRQWLTPPDPEPALVQTGYEPDCADFWCGRNLLTAFTSWGIETFEDAIVISESAAARLGYPQALEAGDKMSNRHGSKGVIGRILPDADMPHLPDGTPVELVFDGMSLFSRMNLGVLREAIIGLLAHAEGSPRIVPPFEAPTEDELRERLVGAGLPEDGMTRLRAGRNGDEIERAVTVGHVYWGKLVHRAEPKLDATTRPGSCQRQGALEYYALRRSRALETIRETFNTRAAERPDAGLLHERAAAGLIEQAAPPSPQFAVLTRRLAAAGVRATYGAGGVKFELAAPTGDVLTLAQPVTHPWLSDRTIRAIGECAEVPMYRGVVQANAALARLLGAPAGSPGLTGRAVATLEAAVRRLFDALVGPAQLRFSARSLFSGHAVATPGRDKQHDQVGIPNEIAWTLFGPQLAREIGILAVESRSEAAEAALDALMARRWVLIHRAPVVEPTGLLAFRPSREPGRVLRLNPAVNELMNADFDGDVLAVILPVTEAGQQEAGERLSIAGRLRRDPGLLSALLPIHAARYGLVQLGRTDAGIEEISRLAGVEVRRVDGMAGHEAILEAARRVMECDGVEAALAALDRLTARGFEAAKRFGVSMSPFSSGVLASPSPPSGDSAVAWERYAEERHERLLAMRGDIESPHYPQLMAAVSGSRGTISMAARCHAAFGMVDSVGGVRVAIRRSLGEGVSAEELGILAYGSRLGHAHAVREIEQIGRIFWDRYRPTGLNVLDRAMRSQHPGVVFARAAASGETDPLSSVDSRALVGL